MSLLAIKLPKGNIQISLELQELAAASHYGIEPHRWDRLPVDERTRLVAAYRDKCDLEHIANLPKEDRDRLRFRSDWVILDKRTSSDA
jgi:hypothetical protein